MGESFKKVLELAESASKTFSETSKDIASEIDKASKIIEDGVRAVEEVAEKGNKLNEQLERTIIDLQKDFHGVRDESDKLVNQTKDAILQNIDNLKSTMDNALDSEHPSIDAETKKTLLRGFSDIKPQTDVQVNHLVEMLNLALENAQKLVQLAMTSSAQLKSTSERTLTEAQTKMQKDFREMSRTVAELGKHCLRDFTVINDTTALQMSKVIDHVDSMTKGSKTNPSDAKAYLEKEIDEAKVTLNKNMDNVVVEIIKSINQVQKQSEKALSDFKKVGEKSAKEARKSV